jgi:hypothetical protein
MAFMIGLAAPVGCMLNFALDPDTTGSRRGGVRKPGELEEVAAILWLLSVEAADAIGR